MNNLSAELNAALHGAVFAFSKCNIDLEGQLFNNHDVTGFTPKLPGVVMGNAKWISDYAVCKQDNLFFMRLININDMRAECLNHTANIPAKRNDGSWYVSFNTVEELAVFILANNH
ncbi:hypothetical protein CXF85_19835 [Colwellia sp. 75C3]|uniref:hypothetical protein n=1 Tax=Colwellia sp. 75C3 TaxID=888425 RepID=UPI000C34177A|nr:hypothetical protein [Colwellia sp. 75C3]PKG81016.1 hypothetical protein CXF85_19835 [Colwellia sp. 75C3]